VFDRLTEPVLAPIRAVLPPVRLGAAALDLSPIVVFIVGTLLLRALCG
jgi:YggT family protein